MDSIIVKGGPVLSGRVATSGAKNAALPVLISSLLADGTHTFERVPLLRDIDSTHQLLEALGCEFERDGTTVTVNTSPPAQKLAPYDLVRKMRASILCLGPLLARYGEARVSACPAAARSVADPSICTSTPCDDSVPRSRSTRATSSPRRNAWWAIESCLRN